MESYEDLPIAGVIALFREAWAMEREQTEFRDDEDPAELAACGENLVAKYLDEVAPAIEPAAVELHVEGEIAGVCVQGWIDLLDVNGRILDIEASEQTCYSRLKPCQTRNSIPASAMWHSLCS